MSKEVIVPRICSCLDILARKTGTCKVGSRRKEDALLEDLQSNIDSVVKFIEDNELKRLFGPSLECLMTNDKETSPIWQFTAWVLTLVYLLNISLLDEKCKKPESLEDQKTNQQLFRTDDDQSSNSDHLKGLLSISQQKSVKSALQFIVALGIWPNLLSGIGIPIEQRSEHAVLLGKLCQNFSFQSKHRQLVSCIETFLCCLKQDTLQSIILTYFSKDLLGALFQLCYAPIKKIKSETDHGIPMQINETKLKYSEIHKEERNLAVLLARFQDKSICTDEKLISEMWVDRCYFAPYLEKLLKQISPSLLMWELLLFQGLTVKDPKFSKSDQRTPIWLKKICNKLLTDLILQSNGIAKFVQSVLDRASDSDVEGGNVDRRKLEAVALLIACNPVKHMSFETYLEKLSSQVIALLAIKGSTMDVILKYIASSILLQLCNSNMQLAEKHFLQFIFKPLVCMQRLSDTGNTKEGEKVNESSVTEKELTLCIENIHQVFVLGPSIMSQKFCHLLEPFYNCLCCMFSFMQSGKSFLRSKVKELLVAILNSCSSEEAVSLLSKATFHSDQYFPCLAYGDEGGIKYSVKTDGIAGHSLEITHCDTIYEIVMELPNKKIKTSFFMNLLKDLTKQMTSGGDNEDDVVLMLKNKVVTLSLLQKLSEVLSEDLISDICQAVDLVNIILENVEPLGVETETCVYGNETITIALIILRSLIEYKSQLTASHWSALKKCLPGLSRVQQNSTDILKTIAEYLHIAIATHGSSLDPNTKKTSNCEAAAHIPGSSKKPSSTNSSEKLCFCRIQEMCEKVNNPKYKPSSKFEEAVMDLHSDILPERSHALAVIGELLKSRDKEAILHKESILEMFMEHIAHDDSYIYLRAIRELNTLAEVDVDLVLPVVLLEFKNYSPDRLNLVLRLGEVILEITKLLGELIVKYEVVLLDAFFAGAKCEEPSVRCSSLSNLGETCKLMQFRLDGHLLQEVLSCTTSLLKTDPDLEVRRSAAMVIKLLLQGMGKDALKIFKEVHHLLKDTYNIETDDVLRLHTQLALDEINQIMKDIFSTSLPHTKEIRILPSNFY